MIIYTTFTRNSCTTVHEQKNQFPLRYFQTMSDNA